MAMSRRSRFADHFGACPLPISIPAVVKEESTSNSATYAIGQDLLGDWDLA
jgi:hypothetical protein